MQVTVESTGTLERRMRVELPAERIDNEVNSRLKAWGRKAKIKGFRPGKVPPKVVKQHYGKQIRDEVLNEVMQQSFSDALVQEKLNPAGGPRIEPADASDASTFAYVATFEVMPEFELRNLDKIAIDKPSVQISDADIDEMILKLRKQKATWQPVERAADAGDRVVVDFEGTLKGERFDGGTGKEIPVVLGSGRMLEDFEKGLHGMKPGGEKSIKVKFPKDYHAEDLAGKKVDFALKVHRVEEEILPPVDDKLAEMFEVSEGGLEQFLKDVRENMEREARAKVQSDIREQVMNGLLEANPIDIPQTLKHSEMHTMQHEAMRRLGIKDHDQAPPMENFAEMAEKRVRLGLLVSRVIDDQKLTADEEKIRQRVEELCSGYENADDMVRIYMSNPQVIQQIQPMVLEQQALDWLMENGKTKDRKVAFSEYMNT